jgi:hypothetical protein
MKILLIPCQKNPAAGGQVLTSPCVPARARTRKSEMLETPVRYFIVDEYEYEDKNGS